MASNTMNFGPEWMRRFPAKSNSSHTEQNARASSPPPAAPPNQDWNQPAPAAASTAALPAFSYSSIAASNVRNQNGAAGSTSLYDAAASDGGSGGTSGSNLGSFATDSLNPFKYSKDLMLSLYRPTGLPIEFERHEYMTSEESLQPMSSLPFSDQEIKLLAGSVNSEVARRTAQPGDGPQERPQGQRRESFSNTGEHSTGRYDRSDKVSSHSRSYEPRSHGVGARPRNLNSEGRSHSFRRTEQIDRDREREREPEDDGLWNSPVGNTVGSFDANGVFRVVGDGDELQPLAELEEPTSSAPADDVKGASSRITDTSQSLAADVVASQPQEPAASDHGPTKADLSSPDQQHQDKAQDKSGDGFLFSSGLLSEKVLGAAPVRDDADFAPFNGSQPVSSASSVPVPEATFEPLPLELSKWLYRDPSGSIQGPFSSEEMHEWYKGGFFSPDLLVKREQDPTFEPLGSLIRRIGSDDKPFLLAGVIRPEPPVHTTSSLRPTVASLAQNRQGLSQVNMSSGWVGMSAPSTPSTANFGVDRLLMQQQQLQQQQQQHVSGDLFSSTNLGQQRTGFSSAQDPTVGTPGLDSRWNSGLFGRTQAVESNVGWGGDAFSRSSVAGLSAAHTPLGGPHYLDQQQRLHSQEMERQQFMQSLQRQSQMQAMLHQQQFMQAQQQFGNDPHALANLLAQQQAQQRQLQLRYQQLQFAGLHPQAVSTPGGTAIPWGAMGMAQPTSPWTSSIIPPSSENYFDFTKAESGQLPHAMQQRQQQHQHQHQHQQQQQPPQPQAQFQPFQQEQQQQHQQLQQQQQRHQYQVDSPAAKAHAVAQDELPSQYESPAVDTLVERLEQLEVHEDDHKEQVLENEEEQKVTEPVALDEPAPVVEDVEEEEEELSTSSVAEFVREGAPEPDASFESEHGGHQNGEENEDQLEQDSVEENASETASSTAAESTHRTIKASPAPWAKPVVADEESERKGPTLREIQEMEAKKTEEARVERHAQMAAAAAASGSGALDFTKGMPGAPAWSSATSTTPKKKTLKEIQEEEEAAMKRARAAAQQSSTIAAPLGSQSAGLAAIVASGTGSAGRRYADTIGPKPATVSASSGPWGSTSAATIGSRPTLASRSSAVFASNPSLNSPTFAPPRAADNSWIEVGSKHSTSASSSPAVSRATTTPTAPTSTNRNSNSNPNEPRPASEEFLRWCRQALKDLQGVVLEDFIQMLLTFPLNPDPMTVEIISESIYANSKSLNGRQFADEFIKRRKADAYPNGAPASMNSGSAASSTGAGAAGADSSFKVVSKKGKKKGTV
ncbi:hypothetical protein BGZ99_004490 [Dissophora globulifera]|uniref:GYF domain-containing protein n=1 Tax=Dissophora globulifera TaxID=979702 RepID=A0A9P6RJL6_9FUNG|nr:hypothetical protein BGZ99_004490 [Dissophora globulifera]